jgi:hypothetical protein
MSMPMPRPALVTNRTFSSLMYSTSFVVHEIDSELLGASPLP